MILSCMTAEPATYMSCSTVPCFDAGLLQARGLKVDFHIQAQLQDVYDLNVLEAPSVRKEACVSADPENPLCQLRLCWIWSEAVEFKARALGSRIQTLRCCSF